MTTITIPIDVAEAAAEALGNFVSDHGWSDSDMQAMDNLDSYIARHKAIRAELAKPVEPINTYTAVKRLRQALRDDLDYAWGWHCNVAMTAYDAGCPRDIANEGAARFMQLFAGVDTRQHFAFSGTQAKTDAASTTPAWHDAPTEPGIWLCDEGGPDCYTWTAHNIVLLNDPALKDDEFRWYGPIPQDGAKAEGRKE